MADKKKKAVRRTSRPPHDQLGSSGKSNPARRTLIGRSIGPAIETHRVISSAVAPRVLPIGAFAALPRHLKCNGYPRSRFDPAHRAIQPEGGDRLRGARKKSRAPPTAAGVQLNKHCREGPISPDQARPKWKEPHSISIAPHQLSTIETRGARFLMRHPAGNSGVISLTLLEGDAKWPRGGVSSFDSSVSFFTHVRCTNIVRQFKVRIGPLGRTDTPVWSGPILRPHMRTGKSACPTKIRRLHAYIFFSTRKLVAQMGAHSTREPREARADLPDRAAPDPGGMKVLAQTGECGWRISAISDIHQFSDHFSCFAMAATVCAGRPSFASVLKSCDFGQKRIVERRSLENLLGTQPDESTGDGAPTLAAPA